MGQNASIPNFADVTQFKVMRNESFTVPDTVQVASPAGISSGLSPATLFDTKRRVIGGYLFLAISDAAGPAALDFQRKIFPGDVIALSNAAPAVLTINGEAVLSIANTAVAGVQGYYA